jgi:hypothetical protein
VTTLAVVGASVAPLPTAAHIVVFKTCLSDTVETISPPMLTFDRRHEARKAGTYSWNALASDKFGVQYADFTLSNETRALCQRAESGGFQCSLTGLPCREIQSCEDAGSRWCYEVER